MKKIFYTFIWYILSIHLSFADGWILWNFKWDGTKTDKALRDGDIHTDDIPNIIKWAIDFMMGIAWTIAIIMIIVWAYQILFWSVTSDKTKWKNTITIAITWFIIASLAWFIIKFIIQNLS